MRPKIGLVFLCGLISSISVNAEEKFDRLFSNKAMRASLSNARMKFSIDADAPIENEEIYKQRNVVINGVMLSGSGKQQIWVNNTTKPIASSPVESLRLDTSSAGSPKVALTISGGGNIILKPGEIYSLETGTIREAFEQQQSTEPTDLASAKPKETDAEDGEGLEFDESKLTEQDTEIELLEDRLEELESSLK